MIKYLKFKRTALTPRGKNNLNKLLSIAKIEILKFVFKNIFKKLVWRVLIMLLALDLPFLWYHENGTEVRIFALWNSGSNIDFVERLKYQRITLYIVGFGKI